MDVKVINTYAANIAKVEIYDGERLVTTVNVKHSFRDWEIQTTLNLKSPNSTHTFEWLE